MQNNNLLTQIHQLSQQEAEKIQQMQDSVERERVALEQARAQLVQEQNELALQVAALAKEKLEMTSKREQLQRMLEQSAELLDFQDKVQKACKTTREKIKLNIGGKVFITSVSTLRKEKQSMLAAMFSEKFNTKPDEDGEIFIDFEPQGFEYILHYLRTGEMPVLVDEEQRKIMLRNADFYQITSILDANAKLRNVSYLQFGNGCYGLHTKFGPADFVDPPFIPIAITCVGSYDYLAIDSKHRLWGIGSNSGQQLGMGEFVYDTQKTWKRVDIFTERVSLYVHALKMVLTCDGDVYCLVNVPEQPWQKLETCGVKIVQLSTSGYLLGANGSLYSKNGDKLVATQYSQVQSLCDKYILQNGQVVEIGNATAINVAATSLYSITYFTAYKPEPFVVAMSSTTITVFANYTTISLPCMNNAKQIFPLKPKYNSQSGQYSFDEYMCLTTEGRLYFCNVTTKKWDNLSLRAYNSDVHTFVEKIDVIDFQAHESGVFVTTFKAK